MSSTALPTTTSSVSLRGGSTVRPARCVSAETFSIASQAKPDLHGREVRVLGDQRDAAARVALEQPYLGPLEPPLDLLFLVLLLFPGLPVRVHPHAVRILIPIQLLRVRDMRDRRERQQRGA